MTKILADLRQIRKSSAISSRRLLIQYVRLRAAALGVGQRPVSFFGRPLAYAYLPSLISLYREIFIYQHYLPPRALGPEPVIVDVGANIGLASVFFMEIAPQASILAFEPNPRTYKILQQNLAAREAKATTHEVALGAAAGSGILVEVDDNAGRCEDYLSHLGSFGTGTEIDVSVEALSSLLPTGTIDLIKLDAEGAEVEIIAELVASQRIRDVKNLVAELHYSGQRAVGVAEALMSLQKAGFEVEIFAQGTRPFVQGRINETLLLRATQSVVVE